MIGIIKDEDSIIFQFNPIFASSWKITRWLQVWIPYSPKKYGQYGISWSFDGWRLPDVWIHCGISTYTSVSSFYKSVLRK